MYISHSGVCASSMAFLYIYGLCKTEKFVHINRYGSYTETLPAIPLLENEVVFSR